jgi:chromatin segregation and condensation protein Rec8/ScpA/Scc1 (kleisin family)
MIGVFLALLELIREKKILVKQEAVQDDLEIVPASEEHRKTYEHASLHLAPELEAAEGGEAEAEAAELES